MLKDEKGKSLFIEILACYMWITPFLPGSCFLTTWITPFPRQGYEGLMGFCKGLVPGLIRVTPACCITFVVYENLITFFQKYSRS